MENKTIEILTRKLKYATQGILDKVNEYADSLLESVSENKKINLTKGEQQILDSQLDSDKTTYIAADSLYIRLSKKYEI